MRITFPASFLISGPAPMGTAVEGVVTLEIPVHSKEELAQFFTNGSLNQDSLTAEFRAVQVRHQMA